jgi:hypothetical protein
VTRTRLASTPRSRIARTAIINGRRSRTRDDAIEAFRVALLNGDAEQRGVAADGLERLQVAEIEEQARRWLAAIRPIAPATSYEWLDDPATLSSLAWRYYDSLPVGERWRNMRRV